MFFGIFQYAYQGQYTYNTAIQSVGSYGLQTAGNILSIIGKHHKLKQVLRPS
jgi:hypothetical protein